MPDDGLAMIADVVVVVGIPVANGRSQGQQDRPDRADDDANQLGIVDRRTPSSRSDCEPGEDRQVPFAKPVVGSLECHGHCWKVGGDRLIQLDHRPAFRFLSASTPRRSPPPRRRSDRILQHRARERERPGQDEGGVRTGAYASPRSRYPLATFSSISPSAWRRASSSLANSLVLACPSLPIRPIPHGHRAAVAGHFPELARRSLDQLEPAGRSRRRGRRSRSQRPSRPAGAVAGVVLGQAASLRTPT